MAEASVFSEFPTAIHSVLEIGPRDRPARAVMDKVVPGGRRVFIDLRPEVEASLKAIYSDAEVMIGDVMDILPGFSEGTFDIVIGSNIIAGGRGKLEQRFFDLTQMVYNVLRPGGHFIVEETISEIGGDSVFDIIAGRLTDQGFQVELVRDSNRFLEPPAWDPSAIQFFCVKPQ